MILKKCLGISVCVLLILNCVAQEDLISNGDFENYKSAELNGKTFYGVKDWRVDQFRNTPIYFRNQIRLNYLGEHSAKSSDPSYPIAYSGVSYVSLYVTTDKINEDLSISLKKPPKPGLYKFSFAIAKDPFTKITSDSISYFFSSKVESSMPRSAYCLKIDSVKDTTWHLMESFVWLSGDEKFLTFWNGKNKNLNKETTWFSTYLIDNVSLMKVKLDRVKYEDEIQFDIKNIIDDVSFKSGSFTLSEDGKKLLQKLAKELNRIKFERILILGYTDNIGSKKDNIILARKRCYAVINFLNSLGINKTKIYFEALGDSYPISSNDTEEGKAKNRRVEFVVY